MLNKNIAKAFNDQINKELDSSYLYLSMANYFDTINLKGFAHWMKIQAQEELLHAMKTFDYIHERGASVVLSTIQGPKTTWTNPINALEDFYLHETQVTKNINNLYVLCQSEKDPASVIFLQWYIQEQVEEEALSLDLLNKLKMIQDNNAAIYMLDKELSSRGLVQSTK